MPNGLFAGAGRILQSRLAFLVASKSATPADTRRCVNISNCCRRRGLGPQNKRDCSGPLAGPSKALTQQKRHLLTLLLPGKMLGTLFVVAVHDAS